MLRLAWKSALGHKGRLLLMMAAIVLGVAFVSGSYVFTDTMKDAFSVVFDQGAGVDIVVRPKSPFGIPGFSAGAGRVPAAVLSAVEGVDGVQKASPVIQGWAQPLTKDGKPIGGVGPPNLAFALTPDTGVLFGVQLRDGRYPESQGEVAIDVFTAQKYGFAVGDPIEMLLLSGTQGFRIVGTIGFGTADNLLGATITIFDLAEAPRALGFAGEYSEIAVTLAPGADPQEVQAAITAVLPPKTEAVLSAVATQEGKDMVAQVIGLLNTVFLAFAGIGLFVGAFLIQNTYRIVVAQRTRELGLLRAVGATGGQVTRLVLLEAAIVGLAASAVGVGAGIGLAAALRAVFGSTGLDIPQGALTVLPRTVIVGLAVGTLVTLASAILPARKASRIPPVAALQELESTYYRSLRLRALVGGGITVAGVGLLLTGLYSGWGSPLLLTGLGAAVIFIGISVVAPLFARSFGRVVGSPLPRVLGVEGRLAQENAVRKPRRTAATASALMIGVALVTMVATLVSSMKASVGGVRAEMRAEYQVQLTNQSNPLASGLSPELARRLGSLPQVAAAVGFRMGEWRDPNAPETAGQSSLFQPGVDFLIGVDDGFDKAVDLGITQGAFADLGIGTVMLRDTYAAEKGYALGDGFPVEFPDGVEKDLRVVALFSSDLVGTAGGTNVVIGMRTFLEHYNYNFDQMVLVKLAAGVDPVAVRPALEAVVADYPNAQLTNTGEYVAKQEGQLNQGLNMMYLMLAMAIIIALLGIANTLALSIMERKREIGLLRAVGMTRRQVRRMIRWEAVLIAVFGAVIGMLVGIGLGVAVVAAIGQGLTLTLPWVNLVIYLVIAALGGVAASIVPGWRGARLDVLDAIAYE